MNRKLLPILAALVFPPALPALAHEHGHQQPPQLQLDAGRKWQTDAPLRQAMNNINQAMGQALPRIHAKGFSDGDYAALAAAINQQVAFAVENCKLPAKADAMLHRVIADLGEGAESMAGKGKASRPAGAAKVEGALKAYGRYFDHPGWKPAGG